MKWIIFLVLIALISGTGCRNVVMKEELRASEQEALKAEPTIAIEQNVTSELISPTVEVDKIEPTTDLENSSTRSFETSGQANADVLFVKAQLTSEHTWTFTVTVAHPDSGWEDYADGWDVVLPDGTVVKPDPDSPFTRLLLHPHEAEQPFTRSQSGVIIPPDIEQVTVRAHDLVDGFGGLEVIVDLAVESGANFEVLR